MIVTFKEALINDIPQIQEVRHSVTENVLSNPALVTDLDCENYITRRGKGWVCEVDEKIVGFAIVDLQENNVWALFLHPQFEGKGIGKQLHQLMLDWYFAQTDKMLWLSTAYNTRAAHFYKLQGWKEAGQYSAKEIKFEMTAEMWQRKKLLAK